MPTIWIVAKWLMLQIIMMISFFTLQKDCVVTFFTFFSVSIATFEEYYKKSRLAFAIWQKFCIVSKNLLEGKGAKNILHFFFCCTSTQTKFSFLDQGKTFLLNYSKWWWTDISNGIRIISEIEVLLSKSCCHSYKNLSFFDYVFICDLVVVTC